MNELTYENATHLLSCAHQVGWRNGKPNARREYSMRCHILKDMGDGRYKILVFGERDWKYKENISRVRYVPKSRLTRRAADFAKKSQLKPCPICSGEFWPVYVCQHPQSR